MNATSTRAYRRGELVGQGFPLTEVSDYLEELDTVVWVDLAAPSEDDVHALAEELGLHELAVEDAIGPRQRPKVDRYATHLFVTAYHVTVDVVAGRLDDVEVNIFFSDRWLITVRKSDSFPIEAVTARWDRSRKLARHGVGFLLYGLLDVIVDGYFAALESMDDYYETVSDGIFSEHPLEPSQQRHWFEMRRESVRFHRLVVPMREVVSSLMRREQDVVSEELYPYYQDVYDHILRISESSDALRDLVAALVEANLSLRDYRQNLIVKKVSSWAAIVAVPALITGYYGMNVPYPGSGRLSGVVISTMLILGVSVALYFLFRRNDWL
ncbi:MAG TPA: magnesium transporter CorA family protein [Acidimicrobiia bacterium]|nr:magnesium transporter CorA family protein [Acidimicrobiia bacterium]